MGGGCRGTAPEIAGVGKGLTDQLRTHDRLAVEQETAARLTGEYNLGESRDRERISQPREDRQEQEQQDGRSQEVPHGYASPTRLNNKSMALMHGNGINTPPRP